MQLVLPNKNRGLYRPPGIPRVNFADPLSFGFVEGFVPSAQPIVPIMGRISPLTQLQTATTPPIPARSAIGLGLSSTNAASQGITNNKGGSPIANGAVMIVVCGVQTATATVNVQMVQLGNGSNADRIVLALSSTQTWRATLVDSGATGTANSFTFGPTLNVPFAVCLAGRLNQSSVLTAYSNGLSGSVTSTSTTSHAFDTVSMFGQFATNAFTANISPGMTITYVGIYNQIWADAQIFDLLDDPMRFLVFPEDDLFSTLVGQVAATGKTPWPLWQRIAA